MKYGYARVSTKEQNEERQLIALKEQGIGKKHIFIDKQSGKDFERTAYQRMLRRLHPGDVLFVKSIDRLGRNYDEILEEWRRITKEKEVLAMDTWRALTELDALAREAEEWKRKYGKSS